MISSVIRTSKPPKPEESRLHPLAGVVDPVNLVGGDDHRLVALLAHPVLLRAQLGRRLRALAIRVVGDCDVLVLTDDVQPSTSLRTTLIAIGRSCPARKRGNPLRVPQNCGVSA